MSQEAVSIVSLITSILLFIITLIYVIYTGKMANRAQETVVEAKRAAEAGEKSAAAAVDAAKAAERSTALLEAQLRTDFDVRLSVLTDTFLLLFTSQTLNIHVDSVELSILIVPAGEGGLREHKHSVRFADHRRLHVLAGADVLAPVRDRLELGDRVLGTATVNYGFEEDDALRAQGVSVSTLQVTAKEIHR